MSSDLSGEITAIATAVLAAFAIITAVVAYMAFRRQTQEVALLQQQMREQQNVLTREAYDRHRAQASRVFLSLEYPSEYTACFNVVNTSAQPVYEAEIRWRDRGAPITCDRYVPLGTILPGANRDVTWQTPPEDPETLPDPDDGQYIILIFRDAAGTRWARTLDGDLSDLGKPRVVSAAELALKNKVALMNMEK